jgi:cell wall-active antibiotic response 4TMS protein YvqF
MQRRYRSFFWPLVLIVIGLIALLIQLGVISEDRLYRLADLWPLILIVIGAELITRRALKGMAVDVATVLILLIAGGGALAYVALGPAIPGGTRVLDTSGPVGTLKNATVAVDVGTATITVQGNTSLGNDLYRAHIVYSGPTPKVSLDTSSGQLRISQGGAFFFGNRHFVLDLQISPQVTWNIQVDSGAATDTFKLSEINVGSIELNTGASREDITLGPPHGVVPISVDGGALTVRIHRPVGTQVSAQVEGGAVNLTGDGHRTGAIGSARWQTDGYDNSPDAYRIEVNGGACTVVVDTSAPS